MDILSLPENTPHLYNVSKMYDILEPLFIPSIKEVTYNSTYQIKAGKTLKYFFRRRDDKVYSFKASHGSFVKFMCNDVMIKQWFISDPSIEVPIFNNPNIGLPLINICRSYLELFVDSPIDGELVIKSGCMNNNRRKTLALTKNLIINDTDKIFHISEGNLNILNVH